MANDLVQMGLRRDLNYENHQLQVQRKFSASYHKKRLVHLLCLALVELVAPDWNDLHMSLLYLY